MSQPENIKAMVDHKRRDGLSLVREKNETHPRYIVSFKNIYMLKKQNTKVTSRIHCAGNTSPLSSKDALTLIPKTWHFFLYDEKI